MANYRLARVARFLATLTWQKTLNYAKQIVSRRWSEIRKKPILLGFPTSLSIEPTNLCNLQCTECPTGTGDLLRPKGNIDYQTYQKAIDELSPWLISLILYFQGEPFLHPQLAEMIRYATQKNVYSITSTNGHFITPENAEHVILAGLDELLFSIDGVTQTSYESYRVGGELEKAKNAVQIFAHARKRLQKTNPFLRVQFIVFSHNETEISAIKRMAKELGADRVEIKSAQLYDFHAGNSRLTSIAKYARYAKQQNGKYQIKNTLSNSCAYIWNQPTLTWDGRLLPCCFDKDALHTVGNSSNHSILELWKSTNFQYFRTQVLNNREKIEICKNCTQGLRSF